MSASPTPDGILRRLEWTVIRRLDGLLHGDYRTLFRGYGLDLADLREYQYQDDVRHIDWNVTARLQTPYVREFNEEREVAAWFLLDMSPSVDFGSEKVKKRAVSTEFVTVLARILTRHGNRVGRGPLRRRRRHGDPADAAAAATCCSMLHRMITRPELPAATATDLNVLLHAAHEIDPPALARVRRVGLHQPAGLGARRSRNLAMRHEVIAVRLYDPLEMELPDLGLLVIQDSETGEQVFVDTHDRGFRKRFAELAAKREEELRTAFRQAGVDALELATDDDLVDAILRFADLRKRRSQLADGRRDAAGAHRGDVT